MEEKEVENKWIPNVFFKKEINPNKLIKKEPILYVETLKESLIKSGKEKSTENLQQILLDLHKMGIILYFNHPKLCDIIITDPQWLNNVFRVFLDNGRREIALVLEKMFDKLNSSVLQDLIQQTHHSNKINDPLFLYKEQLKSFLKYLKGRDLEEMKFQEIFKKYKGDNLFYF